MIGKKLVKGQFESQEYIDCVLWCDNHNATIEDKGECYEVVEIAPYAFYYAKPYN